MPVNVVATTTSALAAGVLRFEKAGQRVVAAAAPAADPVAGAAEGDLEPGVFAVYDARGRMTTNGSPDAMVDAVGELLRAQIGVNDAAVLKRAWQTQGALLDVLA
jgi:hypothetical protein